MKHNQRCRHLQNGSAQPGPSGAGIMVNFLMEGEAACPAEPWPSRRVSRNKGLQLSRWGVAFLITFMAIHRAQGEDPTKQTPGYEENVPLQKTHENVPYGPHQRHVLDFWQAKSDAPTPLVLVIHGGGWNKFSKESLGGIDVQALLQAGISVAANNYRLIVHHARHIKPPVKAPLHDSARALQFLRSKAEEWNIDPDRIAATGGSAGGTSALWLAYHDDMADPQSSDPIARQSTRLIFVAASRPQTSLDPKQMREWTPNNAYGGNAFGFFGRNNFANFLAAREDILPWIAEYSPYELVSEDDPPVVLYYRDAPNMGNRVRDATHSPNFGLGLQQRCHELGVGCELIYPGASTIKHETPTLYLIDMLSPDA